MKLIFQWVAGLDNNWSDNIYAALSCKPGSNNHLFRVLKKQGLMYGGFKLTSGTFLQKIRKQVY